MPRRAIQIAALVLALLGLAWTLTLVWFGGVDTEILGRRITTNEPLKPLLIASVALTIFILAGGVVGAFGRWVARARHLDERVAVGVLAGLTTIGGIVYCTSAASGADAYGYVSQADLWIHGSLRIEQPFMADVPWPNRTWSFAPLGYRPIEAPGDNAIVPTYSAGLPLIMAAAKILGGQCAMYAVVPLSGGLLVLVTYGLGCRLGSSRAGFIGAWLMATSPAFLFMLMWPMTDVPVAAAWATAFYFLLGSSRRALVVAGIATAVAILIRPNLFFAAGLMGIWVLVRPAEHRTIRQRLLDATLYSLAVLPAIVTIALINRHLFGSATTSGYGGLGGMFDATHIGPNLRNYLDWFVGSQTLIPLVASLALVVPVRRLWPEVRDRRVFALIVAFVLLLWAQYMAYLVFETWWYLRFLLASWPFLMIAVGAVAVALTRLRHPLVTAVTVAGVIGLGMSNLWIAIDRSAFELWEGERRYVSAGRLVRMLTEPNSAIFSMQHSGSVRYYSGRMSIRFDNIDDDWLDRAVTWLADRGVHSYLLAEEWEEPDFRRRFARQERLAMLDSPPVFKYDGPGKITLYDLTKPRLAESKVLYVTETYQDTYCVPPAPPPTLEFKAGSVGR